MIDSHCHLDLYAPDADPLAKLEEAARAGVERVIVAGVDPAGWRAQDALAAHPRVDVTYGIHPWTAAQAKDEDLPRLLEELAAALGGLARPVGLGETGLDRTKRYGRDSVPRQERAFVAQLDLARRHDLPVVLHIVHGHGRALEILRAEGLPAAGGVVHRFSGAWEVGRQYLDLGLHLAFSPEVRRSERIRAALRAAPRERLLLESDAPDRIQGQPIDVASLPDLLAFAAEIRGEEPPDLARVTAENTRRLFSLR